MAWLIGVSLIVVGVVFAVLRWLAWWLPQFTAGAGW